MPKLTLRNRLLAYYRKRPNQRIASGDIQRIVVATTSYTPANATRRLRELAEDKLLMVDYKKGHAIYWYEAEEMAVKEPLETAEPRIVMVDGVPKVIY